MVDLPPKGPTILTYTDSDGTRDVCTCTCTPPLISSRVDKHDKFRLHRRR